MQKKKPKIKKKITKKTIVKKSVIPKKKKAPLPAVKPSKPVTISTKDVSVLEHALGEDKELILFFLAYLKFDRNRSKAYKFLHPTCSDDSCRVLGSRMLTKVNIQMILDSYGLGVDTYIKKLKDGLEAKNIEYINARVEKVNGKKSKVVYQKIETPNLQIQKSYHETLGKLLGIEGKDNGSPSVAVQVNNLISDKKNTYGI